MRLTDGASPDRQRRRGRHSQVPMTEGEPAARRVWRGKGGSVTSTDCFADRHIGPSTDERAKMLAVLGYGSLEDLAAAALPPAIRSSAALDVPAAGTEEQVLAELRELAGRNRVMT
jgi:glycine dehydrogenase